MSHNPTNPDLKNSDSHEHARLMIALSGSAEAASANAVPAALSQAERVWLAAHLESCPPCREFAENSLEAIRCLRAVPMTASGNLVSATQMRVRHRAQLLQRQQERFWVVGICCAVVTLSATVTTAVQWHGFAWIGQHARLSAPVWEVSFVAVYLAPAVLTGILLLARGTFLADHNGSHHGGPQD